MLRFFLQPTPMAHWQSLIAEAAEQAGYHCDDQIQHYLAITLDHFTTDHHLCSAVIALDFLLALSTIGQEGGGKVRQVGDECLLLAGLFPERAKRKQVPLEYFVRIGQQAYHLLTHAHFQWLYDQKLFNKLSEEFPNLINVLQTMRKINRPLH
ncbi:MAG: hypothetical protein JSR33_06570 [Proteobacteria bacterium]|nr:hypothetical protein [Pseudomonadota bacterium]